MTRIVSWTRRSFVAAAFLALTGCGWHLRGRQIIPLKTMYIDLGKNSSIRALIRRNLEGQTNLEVVDDPDKADATFHWLGSSRGSSILAVNSRGKARMYSLRLQVSFKVTLPNGLDLIDPTTMSATRDLNWDEDDYNGRVAEEELLYQEMETQLLHRIVTRLSHISKELVETRARDIE
jgi:LPS-assembly lipoprotein